MLLRHPGSMSTHSSSQRRSISTSYCSQNDHVTGAPQREIPWLCAIGEYTARPRSMIASAARQTAR